jgi:hypothetical protein
MKGKKIEFTELEIQTIKIILATHSRGLFKERVRLEEEIGDVAFKEYEKKLNRIISKFG